MVRVYYASMKFVPASLFSRLKNSLSVVLTNFKKVVDTHPFASFLVFLGLLLGVVVVGNQLRKPPTQQISQAPVPKDVQAYPVGGTPRLRMQARVEKSGVIQLVAQTSGVVQKIGHQEGDHVKRGTRLFSFSTSYQGGNIASLSRQIAQQNFNFLDTNLQTQKDAVNIQRQIAQSSETQAEKLRAITRQSFDETQSFINLDNDIIASMDAQISTLSTATDSASAANLLGIKEQKSQILGGLNQAKATLRSNQYLADDNNEPAQLATAQRDLTLKQLDLQDKTLDLNKDLSQLNLQISRVSESLMFPASPCPGTIERIFVKVGQVVNPGTPLAEIRGDVNEATAVLLVSPEIAQQLSRIDPSYLTINNQKITLLPRSISQEPTDGGLNSVIYKIPDAYANSLENGSFVDIDVPVGVNYALPTDPFVPLDAVYQTPDTTSVLVAKKEGDHFVAQSQTVKLGAVYGDYVQVLEGLSDSDQVIVNRNINANDSVRLLSTQ